MTALLALRAVIAHGLATSVAAFLIAATVPATAIADYHYPLGNAATPFVNIQVGSCPTVSFCVAADTSSQVITGNPTGGPSTWSRTTPIGLIGAPTSISCPTVSFCAIADNSGDLATSTDPAGGASAWTITRIRTLPPEIVILRASVSCPSTSLCVVVGGYGDVSVSTDPTGGASAWTELQIPGAHAFGAVSCPTVNLCVIADDEGQIITSTNPAGGAGAWQTTAHLQHPYGFAAISCPTTRFCAAVDEDGGNVATSSDPGGSSWRVAHVGHGVHKLSQVACPSATLCDTLDTDGDLFTSIDPLGESRGWVENSAAFMPPILGSGGSTLSCPSVNLCLELGIGQVTIFTGPGGLARVAAEPHISRAQLSRVAQDAPRLRLTVTSGVPPGQAVKSIAIELPKSLRFTRSSAALRVVGSSGRPVAFKARISGGRLTIALAHASSKTSVTIPATALAAAHEFVQAVKRHKIQYIHLRMTVADIRQARTALSPSVRVS